MDTVHSKGKVTRQAHVNLPQGTFEEEHGREFQRLIDPEADLTAVDSSPFTTADYIEPLTEPLP